MNVFIFFAFDSLFIYIKSNVFCLHRLSMKILVLYFDREFIFILCCIYLFVLFESNTSVCLHNKSRFIVHSLIFLLFFFFFICNPQISSKRYSSVLQNHFYSLHEEKNIKKTKTLSINEKKFISKLLQEIPRHCLWIPEYLLHRFIQCGRFLSGIFVLQSRIPAAIYWSQAIFQFPSFWGKKSSATMGKSFWISKLLQWNLITLCYI